MKLYGTGYSPFVRKVLVALAEKGQAAEHIPLFFHDKDPGFQAASPLGKIPALDDDGFLLADSTAILFYLEAKFPDPVLIPVEAQARGRAIWFDKYGDTEMFEILIKPFANRVVKPKLQGVPGDESVVVKALAEEFPKIYDYLESQISGPFLVGDAFSIADISVVTTFHNLQLAGESVDDTRWPKLAQYVAGILARPSFASAIAAPTTQG